VSKSSSWIQTFTGKQFFLETAETIDIEDIAHSLSMTCRFNGHCTRFYSVAEHSIRVSDMLSADLALWGLIHDAAEAYIGDIPSPIKRNLMYYAPNEYSTSIKTVEARIMRKISEKFGLRWPMPKEVTHADLVMLATEKRDLMKQEPAPWLPLPDPLEERIVVTMCPQEAKEKFLRLFRSFNKTYR